jgi:hypothetical protein
VSIAVAFTTGVYVIPYELVPVVITTLVCWWRWKKPKKIKG